MKMKNILIIITVAATLVSCGKPEPVGYITVPLYSDDIEKYNNGTSNSK